MNNPEYYTAAAPRPKDTEPRRLAAVAGSGRFGVLTDVETELRKMHRALLAAGVEGGARVMELAADIVSMSGRQAVALRDAETLIGEIMRDEVNAQDECEKWLRAYGQNTEHSGTPPTTN